MQCVLGAGEKKKKKKMRNETERLCERCSRGERECANAVRCSEVCVMCV